MASEEALDSAETELLQKHRREKKELQSKIQSLKYGVAKGDKRKKKEVSEEIARIEADLAEKQNKEMKSLLEKTNELNCVTEKMDKVKITTSNDTNGELVPKMMRMTKAKKRREKKADQQRMREDLIAQQEIVNETGARKMEAKALKEILDKRNLVVFDIPSDGNCLYVAVEHQLKLQNNYITMQELRSKISEYMRDHPEEFLPFLTHLDSGSQYSLEEYQVYCSDIAEKPMWGGHLELQALACVLKQPIEVVQAEGPSVFVGEHFLGQPIILSYHKHIYGLGEHYNSVMFNVSVEEDDFQSV